MILTVLTAIALMMLADDTRGSASFPCPYSWQIQPGLIPGRVLVGSNADCAGRQGSLELGIHLYKWNPMNRRWQTDRVKDKTFRRLNANRAIEIREPCRSQRLRATFRWTLRDTTSRVVSRKVVRTKSVRIPPPGCRLVLTGPGAPPTATNG